MKKQKITTFTEAVEYLYSVPRFTSKNSIEDTKKFLHALGNPDLKMHIIHVAGTNGKGSVCAYLRSILEQAGYITAVFTSPHLVDVRERFVIKGQMVSRERFFNAFLTIYNSLDWQALESGEGYHPTFFEYLFFMAMLLFSEEQVDYCILETGLGGRLDATNAVVKKLVSVITRISLDHVEYLGDTVKKIAGEKAGIIQAGVPVVFSDVEKDATGVFLESAENLGSKAYPVSKKDYAFLSFQNKSIDFSLYTRYYGCVRLTLQTQARYQMENAALAVKTIEVLDEGRTITREQIIAGVKKCVWPGRMEEVRPHVFVDGAHNEDGIRAFLESVAEDQCRGNRYLLFGVVQDKDYPHMVGRLLQSGLFHEMAVAHLHTGRAASLESLQKLLEEDNKEQDTCAYAMYDSADTAFGALRSKQREEDYIYIAGSLYLVGEIKELLSHD